MEYNKSNIFDDSDDNEVNLPEPDNNEVDENGETKTSRANRIAQYNSLIEEKEQAGKEVLYHMPLTRKRNKYNWFKSPRFKSKDKAITLLQENLEMIVDIRTGEIVDEWIRDEAYDEDEVCDNELYYHNEVNTLKRRYNKAMGVNKYTSFLNLDDEDSKYTLDFTIKIGDKFIFVDGMYQDSVFMLFKDIDLPINSNSEFAIEGQLYEIVGRLSYSGLICERDGKKVYVDLHSQEVFNEYNIDIVGGVAIYEDPWIDGQVTILSESRIIFDSKVSIAEDNLIVFKNGIVFKNQCMAINDAGVIVEDYFNRANLTIEAVDIQASTDKYLLINHLK